LSAGRGSSAAAAAHRATAACGSVRACVRACVCGCVFVYGEREREAPSACRSVSKPPCTQNTYSFDGYYSQIHLGKVELLGLERPILGHVVEAVLVLVDVGIGVVLRRQTMSVKYE
jgi:hypothetical protein